MKKHIKLMIILILTFFLIADITYSLVSNYGQPDKEKMEEFLIEDIEGFEKIVEYLTDLKYNDVIIDEDCINNGTVRIVGVYPELKIDNNSIIESLKQILNKRNFRMIVKNGNTIYFEKWAFGGNTRGLAIAINKEYKPTIEYLLKLEKTTVEGWYYYVTGDR